MKVREKIESLRAAMRANGLSAYVVPGNDPHASEYMASHWCEMQWLSGFNGESGTVVVTLDKALLWTDSRYYLQAGIELEDSGIELMRESDVDCPSIVEWLTVNGSGLTVGLNPEMFSVNDFQAWKGQLADAGIEIKSIDLIKPLWTEGRPAIPQDKLYPYSADFAGETVESKLARMREIVNRKSSNRKWALIISALDEIAWLLNIRGNDVEYNPVVISYVVLEADKCTLFVNANKIDSAAQNYLDFNNIDIQPYEAVFDYIKSLNGTVFYDGARVNEALFEAIQKPHPTSPQGEERGAVSKNIQSPILVNKAKKNAVELEGERIAMRQDGAALTRFFKWLEEEAFADRSGSGAQTASLTEWDLMEKLHEFRAMGENFVEESFGTIAGYQGNGAIVHYAATKENCAEVKPEGMLLLDSGGQYLDGTTDITRTVWLGGRKPEQAKLDYTYVLKGHIALARVRFPRGTRGNQLDALAKQYMWEAGITFGHGTGHGVGHFLGCHEGPQNVRTDNNPTPLEVGHIISDEPGIYRTDKWGIRTENLITVIPAKQTNETTTEDEWLAFETLTLCFYDTSLIEMSLMTDDEIDWINAYHVRVYKEISPLLNDEEKSYLAYKCAAIER